MPPRTLPNMMPIKGTKTVFLNWIRCTNHTKIHVPRIDIAKASMTLPHRPIVGKKTNASMMPNCADWMVAPVLGDTNLFMQSCCMISPATLMPTPVHRIASSLGILARRKIFHSIPSGFSSNVPILISVTPTNSENTEMSSSTDARIMVGKYFLICIAPPVS